MNAPVKLEIAVQDADGTRAALSAGADRVGLCQALSTGGLTPSAATVDAVHLSARVSSADSLPSGPGGGATGFDITDAGIVASARAAVDRALGGA